MLIGFIAVAGAIVYRVNRDAPPAPELTAISVPAGAEVVSVVPAGDGVYITYRVGARQGVRVVDAQTGAVLHDIELVDDAK